MGRGGPQRGPADDPGIAGIAADGELLDALGRGAPAPPGDEVAVALACWRDDIAAGVPPADVAAIDRLTGPTRDADAAPAGGAGMRKLVYRAVAGLAAAVLVLAGLAVGARFAGPDSPLWPITSVLYTQRADSRAAQADAERAVRGARTAIAQHRYADGRALLDEADRLIPRVRDNAAAARLRAEVAKLRGLLPGVQPTATAAPSPGGAGAATPGGGASPNGPAGGGLPGLPLPSLPGLPLPTDLPSLPGASLPALDDGGSGG